MSSTPKKQLYLCPEIILIHVGEAGATSMCSCPEPGGTPIQPGFSCSAPDCCSSTCETCRITPEICT